MYLGEEGGQLRLSVASDSPSDASPDFHSALTGPEGSPDFYSAIRGSDPTGLHSAIRGSDPTGLHSARRSESSTDVDSGRRLSTNSIDPGKETGSDKEKNQRNKFLESGPGGGENRGTVSIQRQALNNYLRGVGDVGGGGTFTLERNNKLQKLKADPTGAFYLSKLKAEAAAAAAAEPTTAEPLGASSEEAEPTTSEPLGASSEEAEPATAEPLGASSEEAELLASEPQPEAEPPAAALSAEAEPAPSPTFIFTRHCLSCNQETLLGKKYEPALTRKGIEMAMKRAISHKSIYDSDIVMVSCLIRTWQTALLLYNPYRKEPDTRVGYPTPHDPQGRDKHEKDRDKYEKDKATRIMRVARLMEEAAREAAEEEAEAAREADEEEAEAAREAAEEESGTSQMTGEDRGLAGYLPDRITDKSEFTLYVFPYLKEHHGIYKPGNYPTELKDSLSNFMIFLDFLKTNYPHYYTNCLPNKITIIIDGSMGSVMITYSLIKKDGKGAGDFELHIEPDEHGNFEGIVDESGPLDQFSVHEKKMNPFKANGDLKQFIKTFNGHLGAPQKGKRDLMRKGKVHVVTHSNVMKTYLESEPTRDLLRRTGTVYDKTLTKVEERVQTLIDNIKGTNMLSFEIVAGIRGPEKVNAVYLGEEIPPEDYQEDRYLCDNASSEKPERGLLGTYPDDLVVDDLVVDDFAMIDGKWDTARSLRPSVYVLQTGQGGGNSRKSKSVKRKYNKKKSKRKVSKRKVSKRKNTRRKSKRKKNTKRRN